MDARQRAFLDGVETDLTTPKPTSKAAVRRMGVAGSVAAAGAAFFALTAAPANAAPAGTGSVIAGAQSTSDLLEDCFQPNRVAESHTKRCGNPLASVTHYFIRVGSCGPGGNRSYYEFNRHYNSSCGSSDIGPARTPCA